MLKASLCLLLFILGVQTLWAQHTGMGDVLKKMINKVGQVVVPARDSISLELQVLRGKVVDFITENPLSGANVILAQDSLHRYGTATDEEGNFKFEGVKLGRYSLIISHVGYTSVEMTERINAAHQLVLAIRLQPQTYMLPPVEIVDSHYREPAGSQTIDVPGLGGPPGTRGEAVRKISLVTIVQQADDSRNDVVIRGNSPGSVLWRMEGVNIPNPNHFNIPGTSGGPVSIINDRMLGLSSFISGIFPAGYGNTTAGVFDLRMRNGNEEKVESHFQFGLLGAELSSEGPVSTKKKSSYLFSLRRSTLGIFQKLPIDIGTESTPVYGDVAFKINFPQKGYAQFSVFGLGGQSKIDIMISEGVKNFYGEKDRDQYFRSRSGVLGVVYKTPFNGSDGSISGTLAVSTEKTAAHHDLVYPNDLRQLLTGSMQEEFPYILRYDFRESRISGNLQVNKKIKDNSSFFLGVTADHYFFNFLDSARDIHIAAASFNTWRVRWNTRDNAWLVQPYVQWRKMSKNNKVEYQAGLHHQYFSLSNSISLAQPRLALKYRLSAFQNLTIGFGLHSQMHATYLYFYGSTNDEKGNPLNHRNREMDFTRSRQVVTGYEHFLGKGPTPVRLKAELYHQYLYNVPVESRPSAFSFLNTGATFTRFYKDSLVNEGRGENYGLELTVDKALSKGYLFLVNGSVFQSKYNGSDRVWRSTDLNGNYILNALFTREWAVSGKKTRKDNKPHVLSIGTRISSAGGRRYGPIDSLMSITKQEIVYEEANHNSLQFRPYFRWDIRFSYKWNYSKRVTHEFTVDIINVLNTRNVLRMAYQPDQQENDQPKFKEEYQLGLLPFFYYRWSF